jgi:hypothetical protein
MNAPTPTTKRRRLWTCQPRVRSALAVALAGTAAVVVAIPASASTSPKLRVSNSGAGGDPGFFYVGGPINITVFGNVPAMTYQVCMTPPPIDRASCRHGRVGRTLAELGAPSRAGRTKLRFSFGRGKVYVKYIRVRKT